MYRFALSAMLIMLAASASADNRPPATSCHLHKAPAGASAKFYTVGNDGKLMRENPEDSGFITCASSSFSKPPPARKPIVGVASSKQRKSTKLATKNVKTVNVTGAGRNRYAIARCERSGFYYTQDGRCVIPATRNVIYLNSLPTRPSGNISKSSKTRKTKGM